MADKAISGLGAAGTLTGTELFEAVQSGASTKATVAQVETFLNTQNTLGCELGHSGAQTITTGTNTILAFDTENQDDGGFHAAGDNTKITIPAGKTGKYVVAAGLEFVSNATGIRQMALLKNGSAIARTKANAVSGGTSGIALSWTGRLAATDYLEVQVFQSSGGNLDVNSALLFFNCTLVTLTS